MRNSIPRFLAVVALAIAAGIIVACGGDDDNNGASDQPQVAVLLSVGLEDAGYGEAANEGIERIRDELGNEVTTADLLEPADFASTMADFAGRGFEVVIANGVEFQDAVLEVAPEHPDTQFVVINGFQAAEPNVTAVDFAWEEAGFLGGIAAGLATESNQVGNVGGIEIPPIERLFYGFEQGLNHVNEDAEVNVSWVGSFTDTSRAREVTTAQINGGADVIWAIADSANPGVFEAGQRNDGLVIGYGVDESYLGPDVALTTVTVDYGKAIFEAVERANEDQLEPTVYVESYEEEAFDLAPIQHVDEETQNEISELAEQARQGEFRIEVMEQE